MSFPRYPEYKDSGVEWLGEVPVHWQVRRVKDIAQVTNGYPFDSALFDPVEGIPLVRIRDIHSGGAPEVYWSGEPVPAAAIDDGDLLIGMDGDFEVAWWSGGRAQLNQRVCCLRANGRDQLRFLYYVLPTPLKEINALTYATTVKHLSSFDVAKVRLALPPPDEVGAIAAFLDRETAKIDALIAEQEKLIALLKEKRQAVISHAVTKGLDPSVSMKDSGVEWLGEVPAHWNVTRLKFAATVQTGVAKGKDYSGRPTTVVPYIRVANVQDGYLALDDVATIEIAKEEVDRYRLRAGDVLMNEGGDFDKLGRGHVWAGEIDPCIHQNHVFAVRPTEIPSAWLNLLTGSDYAQFYFMTRSKQSTNLASISSTNIMELPLLLPPAHERAEIADFVHQETHRFDDMVGAARTAIDLLKERRAALISAAVTGQIDVRGIAVAVTVQR